MAEAGATLFDELMRFKPDGLTANAWAVNAGVSRTIWADLRRHGNPSRRTLEKLLGAVGSSLAEFEALRVGNSPSMGPTGIGLAESGRGWRGTSFAPIPLLDTGLAGEWGERGSQIDVHSLDRAKVIGQLDRPAILGSDGDAYGVIMVGQSMWPRFRDGRRLLVSSVGRVKTGEDVLANLKDGRVLIKELVACSKAAIELRQFNPHVTFVVDTGEIEAIHKVMGEAI